MRKNRTISNCCPVFEFHISRNLRREYCINDTFFATNGRVIFANFQGVREFVYKLNQYRHPSKKIYPGEVNSIALIEEIYHLVLRKYEIETNPYVFPMAERYLQEVLGKEKLLEILYDYQDTFPATQIYKGAISINRYLKNNTHDRPNSQVTIEECLMLYLANSNPGAINLKDLFDETFLNKPEDFKLLIIELGKFFKTQPRFGPGDLDLYSLLRAPADHAPENLTKQINYILENWQNILPENYVVYLLKSKDLLKEDFHFLQKNEKTFPHEDNSAHKFTLVNQTISKPVKQSYVSPNYTLSDNIKPENFNPRFPWMSRVVLIAKNTYVWLYQLSVKYQKDIRLLDQVPDEELLQLQKRNITALWLIGIWERSPASAKIKHIMGNVNSIASAYSINEYIIDSSLGGTEALLELQRRAKKYDIRIACDMVPNHTSIDSDWIVNNPDFFIQTPTLPFPGYKFTAENLSPYPDFDIRIEDGYFLKSDASVVFKIKNLRNKETRYIYHGNDGTSVPWNDTAQLDLLKAEVRQAVIQKILDIAEQFNIIRFDSAMTLVRAHFARLWYPPPGMGGAIPSRADYAVEPEKFEKLFPVEFWKEVVERINNERPGTLLIAEAFWLMENYFVCNLGMHGVYNSAFMNMLRNEDNSKYRLLITNILQINPYILQHYINYLSTPDEDPAILQFGSGEKYFGVCTLMVTLPGIPMFAHGQIEGYTEKYGMEYQRPFDNETTKPFFIAKHEREIFTILKRRYLFCSSENFNFFDFVGQSGITDENVFAFTNSSDGETALVLFNNQPQKTTGKIMLSVPRLTKTPTGDKLLSISIAQALKINEIKGKYFSLHEHISNTIHTKKISEIEKLGWQYSLKSYEYRVFWNLKAMND